MGNCQSSKPGRRRKRHDMSCWSEPACNQKQAGRRQLTDKRSESYLNRYRRGYNLQILVMGFSDFSIFVRGFCRVSSINQKYLAIRILETLYYYIHDPLPLPVTIDLGELVHFMETKIDPQSYKKFSRRWNFILSVCQIFLFHLYPFL